MTYHKKHNYNYNKRNIYAAIGGWVVLIGMFIIGFGFLKTKDQERIVLPVKAEVSDPKIDKHYEDEGWTGIASWYSREGCIGCSENLHMANGQPLDDNALTVAFNRLPLGSKVLIRNLSNNMIVEATVTDTGGFERHGKIIDITPAVRDTINCVNCKVKITEL